MFDAWGLSWGGAWGNAWLQQTAAPEGSYLDPLRAISGSTIYPGATLVVTDNGDNVVQLFADPDLTVPLTHPVKADSAGNFPALYVQAGEYTPTGTIAYGGAEVLELTLNWVNGHLSADQGKPRDEDGEAMPGAARTFYQSRTTELATVYSDAELTTPADNPQEANASGVFDAVYLDPEKHYRIQLHKSPGNPAFNPETGYYAQRRWIGGALVYDVDGGPER
jgi:hypothetical protein